MSTLGLEPRQYALLRALHEADSQSQQAVAERLRIPASTMVSLVDQLEREKMVERRPHPTDRRTRLLHVTGHGEEVLSEAIQLSSQWEEQICAGFSVAERDQLLALLQRVRANIGVGPAELPDRGTGRRPQPLISQEPTARS